MSVDPDLRIALGFVLVLRVALAAYYSSSAFDVGILAELRRLPRQAQVYAGIARALLAFPVMLFLLTGDQLRFPMSIVFFNEFVRTAFLFPAVAGLLLQIWSCHAAVSPGEAVPGEPPVARFLTGPFRIVRYPQWLSDLVLFGASLLATAHWGSVGILVAAVLVLKFGYFPLAEVAWQRFLGDTYAEYAARTGRILPRLHSQPNARPGTYVVPKRFGISEVLVVVTVFAILFGVVNGIQSLSPDVKFAPVLNLYLGAQLLAIGIGQMFFGGSPRTISALVGALALPVLLIALSPPRAITSGVVTMFVFSAVLGALVGYCLGVMAAGLFLVLDWARLARGRWR